MARGRRIDRAQRDESLGIWQLKPLVILPEASDEPIIGVADVDGRLIFSTRRTVFTLQGDTVLPLVDGVGGSLYGWGDGVLVHDVRTRRLFHLGGAAFGQSAAEAGQ